MKTARTQLKPGTSKSPFDSEFVRPLGKARNEFIQVLLSRFSVQPQGTGLELLAEFDYDTPAVWLRQGKKHVHEQLPLEKINSYRKRFKTLLTGGAKSSYVHEDPEFPLRFGNGGTLPVIRMGDRSYYCLFYRELQPAGWNIANGGAESVRELLYPALNIERELREELIVIDPRSKRRYVFDWDENRPSSHPDFDLARRAWEDIFRRQNFQELQEVPLPLKWLSMPDSVRVRLGQETSVYTANCLLNINADDFGIEIDRVAKIEIGEGAILCDGEIVRGNLLNRPVGLFDVATLDKALASGQKEFMPDRLFWNGEDRSRSEPGQVVAEYVADVERRKVWASDVIPAYLATRNKFDLCPAARTVIQRSRQVMADASEPAKQSSLGKPKACRVFVNFASEDRVLAGIVCREVSKRYPGQVFFSDETIPCGDFGDRIDEALDCASAMITVGTRREYLEKPWVKFEWRCFHNDMLSGRKPVKTPLMPFVSREMDVRYLPGPLRIMKAIMCDPDDARSSLQQLLSGLAKGLKAVEAKKGACRSRRARNLPVQGD